MRIDRLIPAIAIALAVDLASGCGFVTPQAPVKAGQASSSASQCSIAVGTSTPGLPWDFTGIEARELQVRQGPDGSASDGKASPFAIAHWWQAWGATRGNSSTWSPDLLESTVAHGSTPFVSWEPKDNDAPNTNPFPLGDIARGKFDPYIDTWAVGAREYGRPFLLSFAHEMNGDWYPWSVGVHGNTAEDYVAAFRHVRGRFALAGVTNVQWVWTVNSDLASKFAEPLSAYPGPEFVDWIGIDVYNFGGQKWGSLASLLNGVYSRVLKLPGGKPVVLAEWASAEAGGDKAEWILDAAKTIPVTFPRIRAVIWFDQNNSPGTQWAMDTSSRALAAQKVFRWPPYCSRLPY
jgi:hypothetical protein